MSSMLKELDLFFCLVQTRSSRFLSLAILSALTLIFSAPALANSKYAAIVIDGNTGKVLHERHADDARFPASLTKIMTLYILFDYLKKNRLNYNTKFYVTSYAASRPPSKLGLKKGSFIKVKNIIGALVTKSANDVATVVAENIAGSEEKFARMMTRKAKALGMVNTIFKNASGLPHKYQKTTARDMAKLSVRIMNDFPRFSKSFKTRRFKYRGRAYRNHNGLLYSYKGTEGIKTGYTRASGFNLTSSVKRGRKHLIAVVMGGKSARSRNAQMRRLLNKHFPKAVAMYKKKSLQHRTAQIDQAASNSASRVTTTSTSWKQNGPTKYARKKSSITAMSFDSGNSLYQGNKTAYDIQIGAYQDRAIAVDKLSSTISDAPRVLDGHQPYIMPFEKNGVHYHRARFAGFASRTDASSACNRLKKKLNMNCIVMIP